MYIVILTAEPQPRVLQLPTSDGALRTAEYDTIADIIADLKGMFIGVPSPQNPGGHTLPGKDLAKLELDSQIWALNMSSGETVFLNELLK